MNWYNGSISEAVAHSKAKNAIFVVYVEGKDEATVKLGKFINDKRIRAKLESEDFVAIKIESESESYMQFASIFQIVPVPSIFFIGKSGTPLDIATGVLNSVDELEEKIGKVLRLSGKKSPTSSSAINDFIEEEAKASNSTGVAEAQGSVKEEVVKEANNEDTDEIVCKDGVCYKKPKESIQENAGAAVKTDINQPKQDEEAKLAETRKYLEQKRRERVEEEKRLEKERELRRRKEGKEMQNLRAWQKDQEFKELKENIKREKLEEQAARERIRAQIAADKAERAHKFAADTQVSSTENTNNLTAIKSDSVTTSSSDESRLQFRFASGTSNTQNFKCSTTLAEVRNYVSRELLLGTGIKDFTLATTYPKRELSNDYDNKTLSELQLFPSAVILIISKEASGPTAIISRNGGLLNIIYIAVMTIVNPILSLFASAKNWVTGKRNESAQTGAQKRANEDQFPHDDSSKRRNLDKFLASGTGNTTGTSNNDKNDSSSGSNQDGAYRRYAGGSNIHRLSDNRKDSDDENATWNGNSTQQQ